MGQNRRRQCRQVDHRRARRRRQSALALALAGGAVLLATAGPANAQVLPATRPSTTQPLAVGANGAAATLPATRPNGANANGTHGVTTQPGGGLLLNFKEASIDSVLDELSAAAGFIVIKVVPPQGRVTLVSKQPVKPEEAVSLLNSVLRNAGYAAVRQGRVLKINTIDKTKRANIPVHTGSDPDKIEDTDELITQVIPLKGADATQLKTDLAPLMSADADFTANASSNALVITDTSTNIKRIVQIVQSLDISVVGAADVRVIQLQYANAATIAKLVTDVFSEPNQAGGGGGAGRGQGFNPFQRFGGGGGGGGGGGFNPFGGGRGGGGGGGGGRGNGGGAAAANRQARVTAASDDRTNTVVVSGPVQLLDTIVDVVHKIDANPLAEETVFIYKLKNAQALNVESVMNSLFNGTTSANRGSSLNNSNTLNSRRSGSSSSFGSSSSGRSSSSSSFGGGLGSSRTSSFGGGSSFGGSSFGGGNRGGFSSSASRTGVDLAGQVTIIADPDTNSLLVRTKPQNYDRVKEVLKELDRAVPQVLIKVLVAEVTHDNSADIGAEFSALNLRANGNGSKGGTNFGLSKLSGRLVAQVLENDFTATIRALETVGKLDVLSRPYILASDNQLASITVGQEVPFINNSRITDTGQTINTLDYKDVGILLDVVPHINSEGLVILDVAPEISALTGETVPISDTAAQPIIAKRSAQTRVGIRNGQTIVIGGLMEDRKTETIDKVPFIGDIPYIGEAFKRKQNKKTKTELLIFLTPHVAAEATHLKDMSKDEIEGSKLVPNAVDPNAFQDHMEGLQRGHQPDPPPQKDDDGTSTGPDGPKVVPNSRDPNSQPPQDNNKEQ